MSESRIIAPTEWMADIFENSPLYRGVSCLEHLINEYYPGKDINVVEVGPMSVYNEDHIAPISILSDRNPELNCLSIGAIDVSKEQIERTLSSVEYLQGILSNDDNESGKLLIEKLGGNPHIIYGQHVFENSMSTPQSLPFGPYKIVEKCAEILVDGGFIVVDNAGGKIEQVGMQWHWPNSKKMIHTHSYMYSPSEGIYVFQKVV